VFTFNNVLFRYYVPTSYGIGGALSDAAIRLSVRLSVPLAVAVALSTGLRPTAFKGSISFCQHNDVGHVRIVTVRPAQLVYTEMSQSINQSINRFLGWPK